MTFPVQPDYGDVEFNHNKLHLIARDVEAMAAAFLAADEYMTDGGAITGNATLVGGCFYHAAALGGSRTLTLPAAATPNSRIVIVRSDVTANTLAVGSLFTMPASKAGLVVLIDDGVNWQLEQVSLDSKTVYATVGHCSIVSPAAGSVVTLAGNLTTAGAFNTIFTQQQSGNFTLPNAATGTLATLAGSETLTNKRLQSKTIALSAGGSWTSHGYAFDPANGSAIVVSATDGATCTITLGGTPAVGDRLNILCTGAQGDAVAVADAVGTITLSASKKSSVQLQYTGAAWLRVGAHYQEA